MPCLVGASTLGTQHAGIYTGLISKGLPSIIYVTTGRYQGFTEKLRNSKETVAHELLGQCCDDLFAIVAVSCIRLCLISAI